MYIFLLSKRYLQKHKTLLGAAFATTVHKNTKNTTHAMTSVRLTALSQVIILARVSSHMMREWSWEPPLSWPRWNCSNPSTSVDTRHVYNTQVFQYRVLPFKLSDFYLFIYQNNNFIIFKT